MKKLIVSILALTVACISYTQYVNIPDTAFLHTLIERGVDADEDSLISYAEAEAITSLNVSDKNISDMTVIEAFVNLTYLDCSHNQLTSLDVSGCTVLESLYCGENQLTSLDVSNNTTLTKLQCRDMPSLTKVCVWTLPFPPAGVQVYSKNSTNVYFTTDCSK